MSKGFKGLFKGLIPITLIIIAVVLLYPRQITSNYLKISVSEARSRRFGMIFDARTLKERDNLGYYPNSIPVELNTNIPKNTWILVYSGDNRALNAAEALHKLGYVNVRYITEPYMKLMPGY